jgi:hypothetical protein
MEKIDRYREILRRVLSGYVEICNQQSRNGIENILLIDEKQNDFLWLTIGWSGTKRLNGMTFYARIHNDKIWIEEDWTEIGIANDLVREGVPKEDIVLAFHAPEMRPYTDFAAA